jgi:hypothetical protein
MKETAWNVIELVNGHQWEHRVLVDRELWGHENLPGSLLEKIFASPEKGMFDFIDKEGDLRHYTWSME